MLQTVTQNAIATDIEDSFSILGLRPNTKYILVLTTNTYDAGYDERALTIYPSVEEWLIDTIQTLYDHSDFAIIIKLHPKFAKLGLLPSEHVSLRRWIEESPARNKRISVVTPNLPINSYQLMANAEFAATFSSTATMELPILGKFVAPLRHLYYSGKGFTVDSTDKESYRSNLKSLVARANIGALTQTDKAISNAYILFFIRYCSWSQPFIYRKPSDLVRYPLHELLRSENNDTLKRGNASMFVATDSLRSNFEFIIDVIDSLALNEAEFESQLFRFMAADRVLDLYEKMNPHSNST